MRIGQSWHTRAARSEKKRGRTRQSGNPILARGKLEEKTVARETLRLPMLGSHPAVQQERQTKAEQQEHAGLGHCHDNNIIELMGRTEATLRV